MAFKLKEMLMHLRKAVRISYRTAQAHIYISSMLFFLLLLYRIFPSLFAFLVSSSPVIICTAILLGTLLSYGSPNIPEIEEDKDEKKSQKSPLQVENVIDDIVLHKDQSYIVDTCPEETTGEASNNASNEIARELPFESTLEREISDVPINDQNEHGSLSIQIAKDIPFDSTLGSPWQPVDTSNAYSDFDSESDGSGSSSADASMTDIIPMLDELHPLLDSEHPQPTLKSNENSDSSSSESSHHHESDEDNSIDEVEKEESKEENDDNNEVAVAWNENDQNNVMDLGYSEIERNRRLENLIARRRLRKLQSQRYETEKNLIDLESFYPSSIPAISAPRRNPFDLPQDYDSNLNLPPIPGSAPSVMQPRHNPFDLPYDQVEEMGTISREYLRHHDFISAAQRDMLSRRHENFTIKPSFFGSTTFERQLSGESDFKISFASGSDVESPFKGHDLHEELLEPEIYQERAMFPPVSNDDDYVDKDGQNIDGVVDFNASTSFKIGEVGDNLPVLDTQNNVVVEEQHENSNSSSSLEANEKISEVNVLEELDNFGETINDTVPFIHEGLEFNSLASDVQDSSHISPPQKQFDANISLEDQDLVTFNTWETFHSSNPPVLAEDESRHRERPKINEHKLDVDQSMESTGTEYKTLASDIQADILEVASPKKPFEAILLSEEQNLIVLKSGGENLLENDSQFGEISETKKNAIDIDKNSQSESNYMIDEPSSVDELAISISSENHAEESGSCNMDLQSTSEKNLGDLNVEKSHRNVANTSMSSDFIVSQVVEPNICMFDNEHETGINISSSDSQSKIEDTILSNHGERFLKISSNSDNEFDNEVHEIDENLLSELDVVGDFHVERVPKSNQEGSSGQEQMQIDIKEKGIFIGEDPEMTVYNSKLHILEACSLEELDSVFKQHNETSDLPGIENFRTSRSGIFANEAGVPVNDVDTEMLVVEARSAEDIDAALKQHIGGVDEGSNLKIEEKSNTEARDTDANMLVVDAKSVKDIDAALKQHTEGVTEHSLSEIEEKSSVEATNTDTNFLVLDAKSVDDINSALKQHTEGVTVHNLSEIEEKTSVEAGDMDTNMLVLDAESVDDINAALKQHIEGVIDHNNLKIKEKTNVEVRDTDANMLTLDAKSVEDINAAQKQHVEGVKEPNVLDVEENTNLEDQEIDSDLCIVEAKSIDDISLAMKEVEEGKHEAESNERQEIKMDYSGNAEESYVSVLDTNMDLLVLEAKSIEVIDAALKQHPRGVKERNFLKVEEETNLEEDRDIDPDLHVVEATSIEEIDLAMKQLGQSKHGVVHIEAESSGRQEIKLDSIENAEQRHNKVDGTIVEENVSSTWTSKKNQKKKSGNSDSDTSSSSSSSSSDSD